MEKNRNQTIDFVKGLAIFGIVLCHAVQVIPEINFCLFQICRLGQLGCQVFFFFTGYLLSQKFERELLPCSLFLKKRLGGVIVPWYLAIILYYCITSYLVDSQTFPYLTDTKPVSLAVNFLFLNGLIPSANNKVVLGGWYLGTLVIIWLLFPLLFKLKKNYREKLIYTGVPFCLTSAIILKLATGLTWGRNSFLYFSFLTQLPCVILGMFYREIIQKFNNLAMIKQTFIALTTFILLIVLFYRPIYFSSLITPVLTCLLTVFLLPKIDIKESKITKLFIYLGEKSLYIYLFHVFIVWHFQYFAYKYILNLYDINHTLLFFMLLPMEFILILLASRIVEVVNIKNTYQN